MLNPYETLQILKATKSSNDKMEIIFERTDELFEKILDYALNSYIIFGIKALPKFEQKTVSENYDTMFNLLNQLSSGDLSGNAATEACKTFMEGCDNELLYVFQRIIDKDLKCGCGVKLVNNAFKDDDHREDLIPVFEPMAAYLYDTKYIKWDKEWFIEEKYDGLRCLYFIENGKATCYSRGGKEFESLTEITKEIINLYPEGSVIDGEVIVPSHFEDAMSIIKRKKENAKEGEIFFYVFDVLTIDEWKNQSCKISLRERRETRFHKENTKFIKTVNNVIVKSEDEAFDFYNKTIIKGYPYEGAMLKNPDAPYEWKRSRNWNKIKPQESLDLKVVGYYEGKKGTKNEGRLGGFICEYFGSKGRVEVRVGGGYSETEPTPKEPNIINQRRIFWENRDIIISNGDIMEVEYMEETKEGSIRHPRFVRWRSFKGEKV